MFDISNSDVIKNNFYVNRSCLSWVLFYYGATVCRESNTPGNRFDKPFLYEKILNRGIQKFGWTLPNGKQTYTPDQVYCFVEKEKLPYDYVFFDDITVSQKNWPQVDGASIIISNEQRLKVSKLCAGSYYDVLWIPAYKDCVNCVYSFDESKRCMTECNGKIVCKLTPSIGKKIFSDDLYRVHYSRPMNEHYVDTQEKFFDEILNNISIETL